MSRLRWPGRWPPLSNTPRAEQSTGATAPAERVNRSPGPTSTGWWLSPTPLKNDGRIVSWDDMTFPTEWKVIKVMFQTTNQSTGFTANLHFIWASWRLFCGSKEPAIYAVSLFCYCYRLLDDFITGRNGCVPNVVVITQKLELRMEKFTPKSCGI